MNAAIKLMLEKYKPTSVQEHEQALREIIQEIALVGLWRGKFFEHAAFYGGTALRIFHNLDRFSEDLDFTLLSPDPDWSWAPYSKVIKDELTAFGFEVTFEEKKKSTQSAIKSAFLKTPTVQELLKIGVRSTAIKNLHPETLIRVRVEIDTNPAVIYSYEQKFLEQPVAISVKCVAEDNLFAAKMHAAFFRAWKGRVKGRDWYDVVWFIRRNKLLNLPLFSKFIEHANTLTAAQFKQIAYERIEQLDIKSAVEDCIHFVHDQQVIKETWSREFFHYWFDRINFFTP
jgi:predicted nucleotidyltransferase component of viral defense system